MDTKYDLDDVFKEGHSKNTEQRQRKNVVLRMVNVLASVCKKDGVI